jgi:DNA-binding transcriptional ArsR family regulator
VYRVSAEMEAEPQRRPDRRPIDSLTSPLRRRILRRLHRTGEATGAIEMAADMGLDLSRVNYHMTVLASRGATQEAGLSAEGGGPLYESAVAEDPEILALLKVNEADDEGENAD